MERMIEFLERLLNISLTLNETIKLTSAQRARFLAWCDSNSLKFDQDRFIRPFTVSSLFEDVSNVSSNRNLESRERRKIENLFESGSGIGIDLQSISEMFPSSIAINFEELSSLFTTYELEFARNSNQPGATLTGIFSLKESLIKAGAEHSNLLDLEITHTADGKPIFFGYRVSISHSGDFVTSIALRN